MSEVERYLLDKYPSLAGTAKEYVPATDYDTLAAHDAKVTAQARRLRAALIDEQEDDYSDNCLCATCAILRETSDLEVTP